jgi:hypothetical protein
MTEVTGSTGEPPLNGSSPKNHLREDVHRVSGTLSGVPQLPTTSRFVSEYSFNRVANAGESTRLQPLAFDISSPA